MKEINPNEQTVYYHRAKKIYIAVDVNLLLQNRSTVTGIPALKSGLTDRWMQVGNQGSCYNSADLEVVHEGEFTLLNSL